MGGEYINGDCMEYLGGYADNHFDLAIVDPPYGIGAANMQMGSDKKKKWTKKDWDSQPPPPEYFSELFRISKNQIIWGANYLTTLKGGRIIWNKLGIHTEKRKPCPSFSHCEIAYTSMHGTVKMFSYTYLGNVQGNNYQIMWSKNKKIHPTQKPVALYRWLLQNYAKPGQLILDTHVGSASSLIACEIEGFEYVGFEKDKDYYTDSTKRIKQHLSQKVLF